MTMVSINPATEEELARFPEASSHEVERAVQVAGETYHEWSQTSFSHRAGLMTRAAASLRAQRSRLAGLITAEMGKPIVEAEAEIEKCAWTCDHYAENAEHYLAEEPVRTNATLSLVQFQPLGVVLAIMPWNFPFWQVFRFAAPALMAGNTTLLKHASNVPQSALAIQEVFHSAGFPVGAFQTLLIGGEAAGGLIGDPRIAAVTLTGSDVTGSRVAALAGQALKKTVLELGGSDPFIVLADADLDTAAATGCRARNQNSGQSCIAAKRFIVVESVSEEFEKRFATAVAGLKIGDPSERATQIGPLARKDLVDSLERQVRESVKAGARVVVGGERRSGRGYFFQPTVLTQVTSKMPAFREETFGPSAAVIRVRDEEEAIAVANDTAFGLGASLWTKDTQRGRRLAGRIEAGAVFVNGMVASDPRLPFGGVKRSGYGRELSQYGIREFTNIQTVWVGPALQAQPKPAE